MTFHVPTRDPWTKARIERAYNLILDAVLKGERCPMTAPFGPLEANAIPKLIALGLIRSEVSLKNFRRVVLLTGEHKGKGTALPPGGAMPWRINGVHVDLLHARASRNSDVQRTPRGASG